MPTTHLGTPSRRDGHTGSGCIHATARFQGQRAAYNGTRPLLIQDGAAGIAGKGGTVTGILYCGTASKSITKAKADQANNTGFVGFTDGVYANTPQTLQYGFKNASREFWFARGGTGDTFACDGGFSTYRLWMDVVWAQVASAPTVVSITPDPLVPTSMVVYITGPSDNGGATVTTYTHQFALNSTFATIVKEVVSPASKTTVTGLTAGVTYFHRVMAVNAVSVAVKIKGGAASTTKSFTVSALPGAPSLTVTPNAAGTAATVKVKPPSNTGGLSIIDYDGDYEYLVPPPKPSPSLFSFHGDSAGKVPTVSPLRPGATYRWRARARNSAGYGPFSAWLEVTQERPAQLPGEYFDGATPDADDVTFSWTSSPDTSTSLMTGQLPIGWGISFPTGFGTIMRATGAAPLRTGVFAGSHLAQVMVERDTTTTGTRMGSISAVEVVAGQLYWGSIYVISTRIQRLSAILRWYDASHAFVDTTYGVASTNTAGVWKRYAVAGTAPEGAVEVMVQLIDRSGSGWTPWRGGDVIRLDAAMVTLGEYMDYFDGSTPDTSRYDYAWAGTAHASISSRTTKVSVVNPLLDPECEVVPAPPRPPTVLMECVDEIGMWQRRYGMVPKDDVSDWLTMVPTIEFRVHDTAVRQLRLRMYPNPFDYHPLRLDTSNWCAEQFITYIPANSVLTLDGVTQRVWVEVNDGPPIAADHLLFGAEGKPAVWPELSCGIPYLFTLDTSLDIGLEQMDAPLLHLTRRM
jgi:hypothetical protein